MSQSIEKTPLAALLDKANSGYPDGYLAIFYDPETGEKTHPRNAGDGLAEFIAVELIETFDEDDDDHIETAVLKLRKAIEEIQGVIDALEASPSSPTPLQIQNTLESLDVNPEDEN